jgi:hypothetical protein
VGLNDMIEAPRRGRPPLNAAATVTTATDGTEAPAAPGRRRRSNVGGHALKLAAPSRPGFVRRWFNDDKNRLADAEELAYTFVEDPSIKSTDAGSRVSRLVGTQANGEPLRSYLMETPVEEYQAGAAEKEAINAQTDDAIRRGVDTTGQLGTDAYGHGFIKQA